MQGGCRAGARARRTDEQVSELAQALERRGPLRPSTLVGRVEGRCDGTVVRDVDGGVGEEVERACGLTGLLAAERRQVELRLVRVRFRVRARVRVRVSVRVRVRVRVTAE